MLKSIENQGIIYAVLAFAFLRFDTDLFKQVASVSPLEALSHRIVWSVVVLVAFLYIGKQFHIIKPILIDTSKVKYLILSA